MSVNRFLPHVLVLPEDDANRQLAIGFQLNTASIRQMQVLEVAGEWHDVLNRFRSDHINGMEKHDNRFMVLLIDFDGKSDRLAKAKAEIPDHLIDRVFILGAWTTPEALRQASGGTYETIGSTLAQECRDDSNTVWDRDLLRHNVGELNRLRLHVHPILFNVANN